jgi:hypothetical protein
VTAAQAKERAGRNLRTGAILLGSVALVALLGFGIYQKLPRSVPSGQPPLVELARDDLSGFREAFNAAYGGMRVVLLLSPT